MYFKHRLSRYLHATCFCMGMLLTTYAATTVPEASRSENKMPVLMVYIQDHASSSATANAPAFTPYHGAIERSPYLGWIILICAWLLPAGMLVVTIATVFDFRKRRRDDELFTAALAAD